MPKLESNSEPRLIGRTKCCCELARIHQGCRGECIESLRPTDLDGLADQAACVIRGYGVCHASGNYLLRRVSVNKHPSAVSLEPMRSETRNRGHL
jgi:hypothetical protein